MQRLNQYTDINLLYANLSDYQAYINLRNKSATQPESSNVEIMGQLKIKHLWGSYLSTEWRCIRIGSSADLDMGCPAASFCRSKEEKKEGLRPACC
jgi:hypothetical protein